MELKEGMSVYTPGGEEVGKVNRFVLDPETNEVTHIVIQKGWLLPEDKVVPFEMVRSVKDDRVILSEKTGDFDKLPPFEEIHFVRVTDEHPGERTAAAPGYYWYPTPTSLGFPTPGLAPYPYAFPPSETQRNIPEDAVPLKEGVNVVSSDGKHVGDVERLFLDEDSNKVTHFVISQGILFRGQKLIPAYWVRSVEEDQVNLVVQSQVLERLPSFQEKAKQ